MAEVWSEESPARVAETVAGPADADEGGAALDLGVKQALGPAGGKATRNKSGYLPSLDGWRALAVLGVIWYHDALFHVFGHTTASYQVFGRYGVFLFFAISGVLITWRLLEDEAARGELRIRAFYLRRLFRIQPAAWAYLGVLAVLMLAGVVHNRWWLWLGSFLSFRNFQFHDLHPMADLAAGTFTAHFWTLGLEEQFYVLLSVFLLVFRKRRLVVLAAALVLVLSVQAMHPFYSEDVSPRRTFWMIQYLAFPAMLGLMVREEYVLGLVRRYLHPGAVFCGTLVVMLIHHLAAYRGVPLTAITLLDRDGPAMMYCFGFWVLSTVFHPESLTTRFLELPALRYLGRLSYSLYLWHILFFAPRTPEAHVTWKPLLLLSSSRPVRYAVSFAVAAASYHVLEKPMMRLGHRLAPPSTPGHRDLGEPRPA